MKRLLLPIICPFAFDVGGAGGRLLLSTRYFGYSGSEKVQDGQRSQSTPLYKLDEAGFDPLRTFECPRYL